MPMSPVGQLYHRLSEALGGHDVLPEERSLILAAWQNAGGEESGTWEKMSLGSRALVEAVEKRAPESWADPADLPDQQGL